MQQWDSPGILAFLGESVCLHDRTENPAGLLHCTRWVIAELDREKKIENYHMSASPLLMSVASDCNPIMPTLDRW